MVKMRVLIEDSFLNCEMWELLNIIDFSERIEDFKNEYNGDFYTIIIWCEGNMMHALDCARVIAYEVLERGITLSKIEIK